MNSLKIPVIAAHIAGWVLFQCLPLVFILTFSQAAHLSTILISYQYWLFCLYFIILFYLHSYVLVPYFLEKKKWLLYTAVMLLLLLSVVYLQPFEQLQKHIQPGFLPENRASSEGRLFSTPPPPPPDDRYGPDRKLPERMPGPGGKPLVVVDIISIFLFIITICFSAAIDIARRWRLTEQRAARAEADKANAELSFLKAQINPHFLFNTLNNIYSMVVTNNENTAGSLLKLSNILRYVIDESREDYVSLKSEVDCITDYIDLQRLRLGKKASLEYLVTGNLENKKIAPMILMSFIENVFKYGISNHEEAILRIQLDAEAGGIRFFSENPLFSSPRKTERTGIGISNTEKRLAHLYPGRHQLQIIRENGLFSVHLFLQD